ncbi:YbaB/EbfC family nucleoid-associated protein [Nitrosomonas sp.]|uniref:YbaB/EbfC family nucleoid-associated protein n=1 Tax=Nitrosomonas sp. TaxID=42353 RepID=UPI001D3137EA|nr:YbaB/EbfC family nucleoid-associated protein [Nitrosomonas sp.]MCB1950018.1 YbaB/EbfC family nucleoid-associated protein [Nitrosomonas sp.]MCP5242226.1 YbaB/EbfC family nucleoid-associated protein [Burkholderiales bacterium]MDR4514192.1 YbaB/EbfC family nucleoid-associated protein [Nitrosomonas sp.]
MKANLANMMKQAQQVQESMKQMQEKLATLEVEGQSGAGMVKIVMTCRHDVKSVQIDDSLVGDGDDKEMLEDLIAAAFNDAVRRVESTTQEKMAELTGGLGLPPGMKLPF